MVYVYISKFLNQVLNKFFLHYSKLLDYVVQHQIIYNFFLLIILVKLDIFYKQFGHCVYAMPALILSLYLFWISKIKKITKLLFTYTPHSALIIRKRFTTEWERLNPKILNEIKASKAAQSTITTTKLQPKTSKIMMKKNDNNVLVTTFKPPSLCTVARMFKFCPKNLWYFLPAKSQTKSWTLILKIFIKLKPN